jgi:hypothetical protein
LAAILWKFLTALIPLSLKNLSHFLQLQHMRQNPQKLLSLMGKVRNIFAVEVGRYKKRAPEQRLAFAAAKAIWCDAALGILSI